MTRFDTIVIVDWSGGKDTGASPRKDAIWASVARSDLPEAPVYLRNRMVARDWLIELFSAELDAGRRVLAGFDFPFGYPRGFAERVTGSADALAVWDWYADHLRDDPQANNRFELASSLNRLFPGVGPFWFNGEKGELPDLPRKGSARRDYGMPDRREVEEGAKGAFTCWQMGGAGAVGSQVMTGMAALARVRQRFGGAVRVWPFEPLDAPLVLAEVWPSLAAEEVRAGTLPNEIKDAAQVRILASALWRMQEAGDLQPALDAPSGASRREEGWLLGVGLLSAFRRAARQAAHPDLKPPRLKNDCFALPAGIDWTPVDQALNHLRQELSHVVGVERVAVGDALGRILARDHMAPRSNPPGPNSAVDGFGFAHAATGSGPQVLPLVEGRAAAGVPFGGTVPEGKAIRILTGALLPAGVDTVVLEEDTALGEGTVAFDGPVKRGSNTRKAGEDVEAGAVALRQGQTIRPPDIALLTAVGLTEVEVHARLRVGVLSTGDEIAAPGGSTDPATTYDANRPMLLSLARRWGYEAVDLGHVGDDRDALRDRLGTGAQQADVILTSGGASAGDEDHVSALLRETGALREWRIAIKPGRPLALGLWEGVPVFGLPGNPVAALVCTLIFARPAMAVLSGAEWSAPDGYTVPAAFEKRKKPGRREFLRARLTPDGHAEVFKSEGSGRISGLSWATGLVEIEDGERHIRPGDLVRFIPYSALGM